MGDSGGRSEDQNSDRTMESKGCANKAADRNEDSIGNWTCGQPQYRKNFSTLCPCPETLCKAKFKGDGLINLVEEISRQHSTQVVAWILLAFSQVYCETGEQKAEWKDMKNLTRKGVKSQPRRVQLLEISTIKNEPAGLGMR